MLNILLLRNRGVGLQRGRFIRGSIATVEDIGPYTDHIGTIQGEYWDNIGTI